jgi:hypothetical protein
MSALPRKADIPTPERHVPKLRELLILPTFPFKRSHIFPLSQEPSLHHAFAPYFDDALSSTLNVCPICSRVDWCDLNFARHAG